MKREMSESEYVNHLKPELNYKDEWSKTQIMRTHKKKQKAQ